MALWLVDCDTQIGKTMFLDEKFIPATHRLYTDTAQSKEFGGI